MNNKRDNGRAPREGWRFFASNTKGCFRFVSILLFTGIAFLGCTSPIYKLAMPRNAGSAIRGTVAPESHVSAATENETLFHDHQNHESAYYPHKQTPDGRPRVCLALSGGGLRSAAYSLGVMKALHDAKVLEDVSIISAVSGGSYALTWFYSHSIGSDDGTYFDPFARPSYLDALANHTHWVPLTEKILRGAVGLSFMSRVTWSQLLGETGVFSIWPRMIKPFSFVATTLYRGGRSVDAGVYQRQIGLTFLPHRIEPTSDAKGTREVATDVSFEGMSGQLRRLGLPYFIVNSTIHYGFNNEQTLPLHLRLFEFTPAHAGGPGVGWNTWDKWSGDTKRNKYMPRFLSEVSAISGAAADSAEASKFTPWERFTMWFAEANLGHLVPEANPDGDYMLLTDGGHTENLGVFPLVQRLCETIYLVDAEWEPTFQRSESWSFTFEGYHILKHALECNYNLMLTVPEIDRAPIARKPKDLTGCKTADDRPLHAAELSWKTLPRRIYTRAVTDNGRISTIPLKQEDGSVTKLEIKIVYIKLLADRSLLEKDLGRICYGDAVVNWFAKSSETDPNFPHIPTSELDWVKERFLAYADLGYHNFMNYHHNRKECITDHIVAD